MKNRLAQITFLSFSIFCFTVFQINAQEIKEAVGDFVKESAGEYAEIKFEKFILPEKLKSKIESKSRQRFYSDFVYIIRTKNENEITSVSILDNVLGKDLPITFIAMFSKDGKIISSDIIKYREPYGGAVQNDSWTDQFKDKNSSSSFKVGTEIDGISGATISVNSVARGMKKIILLYDSLKDSLWNSNFTVSKKN
jgi:Na+-translocating ferredoxin:NAD+ oxidoreductase RnfG subunit